MDSCQKGISNFLPGRPKGPGTLQGVLLSSTFYLGLTNTTPHSFQPTAYRTDPFFVTLTQEIVSPWDEPIMHINLMPIGQFRTLINSEPITPIRYTPSSRA